MDDGCAHDWQLVQAVLDGRGAWRSLACARCGAVTVQVASGDLDEVADGGE